MNEYPTYDPLEQIASIQALDRLDQELSAVVDESGLGVVIGKYIAEEMSMTSDDALHVLTLLKESGVFPLQRTPLSDERMMVLEDEYRIGIFTGIMPLYQKLHSTTEYEEWLPRALDVVMPETGNHGTQANCHTVIDRFACWTQKVCPLKVVIDETKELVTYPDFESYDYIVRREEMRTEVMILLAALTKREILTKAQERELTNEYIEKYNQAFSVSR